MSQRPSVNRSYTLHVTVALLRDRPWYTCRIIFPTSGLGFGLIFFRVLIILRGRILPGL